MIVPIVLGVLGAWLLVSVLLALVIGRAIRIADKDHERKVAYRPATVATRPRTPARAAS